MHNIDDIGKWVHTDRAISITVDLYILGKSEAHSPEYQSVLAHVNGQKDMSAPKGSCQAPCTSLVPLLHVLHKWSLSLSTSVHSAAHAANAEKQSWK